MLIGSVFLISGFEKLLTHYQNFLYVVQNYEFLPVLMEEIVARTLPWIELFLGAFMVTGLWFRLSVRLTMVLIGMFLAVVGQALIRGLPLDECGCFGSLITFPLAGVFVFDSSLFVLSFLLLKNASKATHISVDRYFASKG